MFQVVIQTKYAKIEKSCCSYVEARLYEAQMKLELTDIVVTNIINLKYEH